MTASLLVEQDHVSHLQRATDSDTVCGNDQIDLCGYAVLELNEAFCFIYLNGLVIHLQHTSWSLAAFSKGRSKQSLVDVNAMEVVVVL